MPGNPGGPGVVKGVVPAPTPNPPKDGCRGTPVPATPPHDDAAVSAVLELPHIEGVDDHRPAPGAAATGTSQPFDRFRRAG